MEQKLAQLQARLEADQSLAEKLFELETAEEVQGLLKAEGLDFSLEEINVLRDVLVKTLEKGENGELSDEDLEDVAGGFIGTAMAVGAVVGLISGGASFTSLITRGRW